MVIDQFIDYIRRDTEDKPELGDVNQLVDEVVQAETPADRQVIFSPESCPEIPLRYVAIKRAVANLIQNALRYTLMVIFL